MRIETRLCADRTRWLWRVWENGRASAHGAADTEEEATIAAYTFLERRRILAAQKEAERAAEVRLWFARCDASRRRVLVPEWLKPTGGTDGDE